MLIIIIVGINLFWGIILISYHRFIWGKLQSFFIIEQFLVHQLKMFKSQTKIRLRATWGDSWTLALYAHKLNFNRRYIFAFTKETMQKWYRHHFEKSNERGKGPSRISEYVRDLVVRIKQANKKAGYTRIAGQIQELGHAISPSSVKRILQQYFTELSNAKAGTWKDRMLAMISTLFACDFKVVQDTNGQSYYIMFFMSVFNRKIIHYNVTMSPTQDLIKQQLREVSDGDFQFDLITDNDVLFKHIHFTDYGITRHAITPGCPKMNPHIERFIGSFKREALSYYPRSMYNENFLRKLVREYVNYYNNFRHHQSLGNVTVHEFTHGAPIDRPCIESPVLIRKLKTMSFIDGNHTYFYYQKRA